MADPLVEFTIDFSRLRGKLEKKLGGLTKAPLAKAVRSVGEIWMTEAKKRTPVDTGVLRSSGHVQGPTVVGNDIQVRLVFGGPAATYAVAVHENLTAHHTVGQAKYLESVIVERRGRFAKEVFAMDVGGAKVYGAQFTE